ncbi:family 78 glycoside hydrolase catalytic domain [Buttiauxella gaviniae]|uniref:family 78 glycoside hydrolase catalytic domain n=1 Tax=Buttiauxella gaviniae TaxID=82990 RepID=UPI003C72A52F
MLSVKKVTLDYELSLSGIDAFPVIGWEIESNQRNVKQVCYQLQVSDDKYFDVVLFDSGVISSDASVNVNINKILLHPSTRYFVRVKIKDNQGEESLWSTAAEFITGLLDTPWSGDFISAETLADKDNSKVTLLRKTFSLNNDSTVASAYLHVSALGVYQFYLNGGKAGNDELTPGWTSYHNHLLYQTYDLSEQLKPGENAIGAELGAGWYKGDMGFTRDRNYYGEQTALICQLVIHYEDGTRQIVVSDNSWRGEDSPIMFSEIYDGEICDASFEQEGWNKTGFDDAHWRPVSLVSYDKKVLTAQGACKVKKIATLDPTSIITTPQGDTVIDFGQNLSGWVEFKVNGNRGDKVILRHFETLNAQGNVYLDNLRSAKQRVEYVLKGGATEVYHPRFTWQGFRYVKVESYPGNVSPENFKAVVLHSDMAQTGHFNCSNEDLNQLHHNILWGLKGNFIDVPTDCPQRDERLGWTGDAQIFCRTASYLMNTRNFFAKWLRDLQHDQTPEGGVPHVIPDILTGHCANDINLAEGGTHSAAAWADAAVINPWTMYLMYGDTRVLENQYQSMKGWVDFMLTHSENLIWRYKLQFGDWVALDAKEGSYFGATPTDLVCTAYFAYSTQLFSQAAKALNRTEDFERYSTLHQQIVQRFQDEFFTPSGRLAARTQTAHILALYFNLVPESFREPTVNTLVELLREHDGHLVTGFVGTPYFCHALSQNGREQEAWELLLKDDFPSWLYQVKAGATTIWEHWDGMKPDGSMWSADMNSFNHYAYGAVGEWLYRSVAGIEADADEPGFKHVIIAPTIGGNVSWVDAAYDSVYGEIKVRWQVRQSRVGDIVTLDVKVPHNTHATLKLSGIGELLSARDMAFKLQENSGFAEVGSGDYKVEYLRA